MCKLHKNIVRIAVYRVEKFINFIKKVPEKLKLCLTQIQAEPYR